MRTAWLWMGLMGDVGASANGYNTIKILPKPIADLGTMKNKYADHMWWLQKSVLGNPSFMSRPRGLCLCPSAITFGNTLNSLGSCKGQLKLRRGKCICLLVAGLY